METKNLLDSLHGLVFAAQPFSKALHDFALAARPFPEVHPPDGKYRKPARGGCTSNLSRQERKAKRERHGRSR